jgi:uncharacterized protein YhjY with autotransporter beta-barrel domain
MYKADWEETNPSYAINLMENTYFVYNTANGSEAFGGAISNRVTDGFGTIRKSVFAYNSANAFGTSAFGGAIEAGINPSDSSTGSGGGGINFIDGSVFYKNSVSSTGTGANHNAYGGAIALGGRGNKQSSLGRANLDNFTIKDTLFIGNKATTVGGNANGGALYIGTNMPGAAAADYQVVNFTTSAGGLTEFSGNTANGAANGIGVGSGNTSNSTVNVRLNVNPDTDGLVLFADPLRVNMNNNKRFEFNRTGGKGEFRWGGANVVSAAGGAAINLGAGRTVLLPDFNLTRLGTGALALALQASADLVLELDGRDPSKPYFTDLSSITSSGGVISVAVSESGLGDFSREYVFASGAGLPADSIFDMNQYIEGAGIPGLATSVVMTTVDGDLVLKASRTGTDTTFSKAGSNAKSAQAAFTEIFNSLDVEERRLKYETVLAEIASFTAEPLAAQASAGLAAMSNVVGEMKGQFLGSLAPGAPSSGEGGSAHHVWGGMIYRRTDQDTSDGFLGYDSDTFGGIIGFTAAITEPFSLGAYLAAGKGSVDFDDIDSSIDSRFIQFGLVAAIRPIQRLRFVADFSYSIQEVESSRKLPGFGTATADFDAKALSAGLEASYDFPVGDRTTLSPFLELRYQKLWQDRVFERDGGPFSMVLDEISHDDFYTRLGAVLSHDVYLAGGTVITPKASLAWKHRFGGERVLAASRYVGSAVVVPIESPLPDRDQGIVGVGLDIQPAGPDGIVALSLGYDFGFTRSSKEHNAFLTLDFRF